MIRPGASDMVAFLNRVLALDPSWMAALVNYRPPCNQAIADHPEIQVRAHPNGEFVAGILGLLNGFYGVHDEGLRKGHGPIIALTQTVDGHTVVGGFKLLEESDMTRPRDDTDGPQVEKSGLALDRLG